MSRTLEQKIAEAEARLQRLKAKSRSLDTAQKVIVGAAMLARVRRPEEAQLRAFLLQFLRKEVTRQADVNRIQPLINELDDEKREEFRWIQRRAQYLKGEAKVQITFSDSVMPYLTQLQGQFTKVIIKNISRLSRSYSIRIYELLQQFRSTGERIISLDDFRSMLDICDKYQTYKSLNQQLLKPCIDELNLKSDLLVTVETIKKGRTVVALHFRFKEDKQIKVPS